MSLRNKNLFLGILVLLAVSSMGIFGLFSFGHSNHAVETPMVNCPYAENSFSICRSSLEHINNWKQFSNVILPVLLVFSILLSVVSDIFDQKFLNQEKHFYRWRYDLDNKKLHTYREKITRWLALFENSPSLSYKT